LAKDLEAKDVEFLNDMNKMTAEHAEQLKAAEASGNDSAAKIAELEEKFKADADAVTTKHAEELSAATKKLEEEHAKQLSAAVEAAESKAQQDLEKVKAELTKIEAEKIKAEEEAAILAKEKVTLEDANKTAQAEAVSGREEKDAEILNLKSQLSEMTEAIAKHDVTAKEFTAKEVAHKSDIDAMNTGHGEEKAELSARAAELEAETAQLRKDLTYVNSAFVVNWFICLERANLIQELWDMLIRKDDLLEVRTTELNEMTAEYAYWMFALYPGLGTMPERATAYFKYAYAQGEEDCSRVQVNWVMKFARFQEDHSYVVLNHLLMFALATRSHEDQLAQLSAAHAETKLQSDAALEKQVAESKKKEVAYEKQVADLEVKISGLENALTKATEKSAGVGGASATGGEGEEGSEVREGSEYTIEGHVRLPLLFRDLSAQLVCSWKFMGLRAGLLPVPCPSVHFLPLFYTFHHCLFVLFRRGLLTFEL
jgi:hypothetical protein